MIPTAVALAHPPFVCKPSSLLAMEGEFASAFSAPGPRLTAAFLALLPNAPAPRLSAAVLGTLPGADMVPAFVALSSSSKEDLLLSVLGKRKGYKGRSNGSHISLSSDEDM